MAFFFKGSYNLIALLPIVLYALLHYIPLFFDTHHLCGVDFFRYLPGWLIILFSVIMFMSFTPSVNRRFENVLNKFDKPLTKTQFRIVQITGIAVFVILAVLFSDETHLLGDGWIVVRTVAAAVELHAFSLKFTEPLESYALQLSHTVGSSLFGWTAETSIMALTYILAGCFCLAVFHFLWGCFRTLARSLFLGGAFFSPAPVQLYFGYTEY